MKLLRFVVLVSVFTALAAGLSLAKIPSPVGSIALDAAPGYFTAAFFGPLIGGLVGALGHIASASTGGFPLGPLHFYVAVEMFAWCSLFGAIARASKSYWVLVGATIAGTIVNGIVGPLLLVYTPAVSLPKDLVFKLIPFLVFASAVNVILATLAYAGMRKLSLREMS